MRPASAGVSRNGKVTSMVSDASRASSAADFRMSRRAASARVTLSFARLILAPSLLRSSGDILPSVASSAEIEPFLPSAATRTASSAPSSDADAIWLRIEVSSWARSDTVYISAKTRLVVAAQGVAGQGLNIMATATRHVCDDALRGGLNPGLNCGTEQGRGSED